MYFIKRKIWHADSNFANLVTVSFMEKYLLPPITTLVKDLLFWLAQINQCAKSNRLWNLFSMNWCLAWIWSRYHLNLLRVMQLNDGTDRPISFRCALTFARFSNNVRTLSTFSSVAADGWFLTQFPLSLFKLYLSCAFL